MPLFKKNGTWLSGLNLYILVQPVCEVAMNVSVYNLITVKMVNVQFDLRKVDY